MSDVNGAPADPGGQGAGTPHPVDPAAAAAANLTAEPATPPPSWFADFKNPELRGYVEKKNFPGAEALAESYLNLEKFHGVPAERLLKLPEDYATNPDAVKPLLEKIGYVAPKEAKDYGFADFDGAIPEQASALADIAHKHGVPASIAKNVFKDVMALEAANREAMMNEINEEVSIELGKLRAEWKGDKYDVNIEKARRAVRTAGFSQEELAAMETSVGVGAMYRRFAALHDTLGLGEADFVAGQEKRGFEMSPEAAKSEIQRLRSDKDFGARLLAGNAEARTKWDRLNQIAASGMSQS